MPLPTLLTVPRACLSLCLVTVAQLTLYNMWQSKASFLEPSVGLVSQNSVERSPSMNTQWYAPDKTPVNDLSTTINGTGVYDFIFDTSDTPSTIAYSTYNWCNMPHTRSQEYVKVPPEYELQYVEVIHRHHKRTPYASNTFPRESYSWECDDEALFYYGLPLSDQAGASINWQVYSSPVNPFARTGFAGSCQFPQITAEGLLDSRRHGKDLYGVYHDTLDFLPDELDSSRMSFRVTNNQITSQVVGQVILGMFPSTDHQAVSVLVQPPSVDSLEPNYDCPAGKLIYGPDGDSDQLPDWNAHLVESTALFAKLDSVSEVDVDDDDWHKWFDHYFDNLSSRLCHQKPLPCNIDNPQLCITQDDADAVFRRGEYEYSYIYRDSPSSLRMSIASYGVWMAELAANLRSSMNKRDSIIYRHNVAHDGSISRLLSFLQISKMVWPGMGSEVVFELYIKAKSYYVRVLWGGQVFTSSHPKLGKMDLIPVEGLLEYIDELVGIDASKVLELCQS